MTNYDAIVIGAGLGGLAAASRLAAAGLKVRVLEKHVQPGGYATTFSRGRFEFEVSLHALSGIRWPEDGDDRPCWLDALGMRDAIEFVRLPDLFRSVASGFDLRVPWGRDASLERLIEAFPEEAAGLRRFYDELWRIKQEAQLATSGGSNPSPLETMIRFPTLARAAGVSLASSIDRHLRDPFAKMVIGQLWTYFGLPPGQLSLLYFAAAYTSMAELGCCYPEGKSQSFSNALVSRIEASGGEVSLDNGAAEILVRGGRVIGVGSEAGELLATERVVSNANPFVTFFDLIGEDHLDRGFTTRLSNMQPSISAVSAYLGLDMDAAELGLCDHEVFVNATTDLDQQFATARTLAPPDSFLLTAYGAALPGFSPTGTTVVTLTAPTEGRLWRDVSESSYYDLKYRFAERMLDDAEDLYPGLRDHIEVAEVATPLTNMRYTGNVHGAIYGFAMSPEQCPAFRLPQVGPVHGLWLAGAWTQPGGGFEAVLDSGMTAADAVLRDVEQQRGKAALRDGGRLWT